MTDQRFQYNERVVGAGHPTLADTINRLSLIEHNNDGTHKYGGKLLARLHVDASVTGTTALTTLFSATVPGGLIGPNGTILVTANCKAVGAAGAKTVYAFYGNSWFWGTVFLAAATSFGFMCSMKNRNSLNSQIGLPPNGNTNLGYSGGSPNYLSVDSSVDQTFAIKAALDNAADTLTLETVDVQLFT